MFAIDILSKEISCMKTSDTGAMALSVMDELKISHLPVVNHQEFLGLLSEADVYEAHAFDDSIGGIVLKNRNLCISQHQHIFDVIDLMHRNHLSLLPVVDAHGTYLGVITAQNCLDAFSALTNSTNKGGVIFIESNAGDYSLTEISNIVESNDLKIMSLFVQSHPDSTKITIILKLNKSDLGSVLQTFDRYRYSIVASFKSEEDSDFLNERYQSFMHFLNI